MIKTFITIGSVVVLTGCGTQLTDAQVQAMAQPTVTLECETGCTATYTDPRDRINLPTNGYDVANTAIGATANVLTTVAPWATVGAVATKGIANAVGDNNSDNSVDSSDNSVDSSDNSVDSSDNSIDRSDNSVSDSSDNSIDRSDNSVDKSDNSIDRSDNSVDSSDNRTYDSTSDPVVVNPEVITTPTPEIVNPEVVRPEVVEPSSNP